VSTVSIRDVIESRDFVDHSSKVAFAIGRDIGGSNIIGNIAKLPHVLIAGTTGSGKSVCTNSLIISLMYKASPDDVRFIMVDPKMVELAPYNGIPHLLIPVVTDPKKAAGALQWAVFEMMKRYKTFSEHGVKDLTGYNALAENDPNLKHMASVVVVIDELADLMLVAAKEVEESICRVAQMGRAAGMHLVIATQRPSADVITGLMKANIPSRIAFSVASAMESRIILDNTGAEKLVGRGDMLYSLVGGGKPKRVQGCFIGPEEIERVVEFVKSGSEAQYSQEVMDKIEEALAEKEKGNAKGKTSGGGAAEEHAAPADDRDPLFDEAVEVILETGQASVSMLQRRLKLGYSRAARLIDQLEEYGYVGPFEGSKPRQILVSKERWMEKKMRQNGTAESEVSEEADEPPFDME
ncbi:MAG: DNA translocase FtsK, partial [Oscillospiraceae bacterium]|nr:DNA translocase FtsK [Oscillospiraceae bacterium]